MIWENYYTPIVKLKRFCEFDCKSKINPHKIIKNTGSGFHNIEIYFWKYCSECWKIFKK